MIPLSKFVSPEFIYGSGATLLAGRFAQNVGVTNIQIVTMGTLMAYDWFQAIVNALDESEVQYTIFDGVSENPKDYECALGAEHYMKNKCELILAIGGGSVLDCAKGIGILASNPGPIGLYEGVDEIPNALPPLICIPTTAGSAADISQFAIITDTQEYYKMAIVSKILVPDLALIDPALTLTVNFDLTIDTGLDVLAHGIESYVSNAASPFSKIHAIKAIQLVLQSLPSLSRNLDHLELRDRMMQASLQAGLSFSNASLGLVHALAHILGGRYNLIHGELNGILLPSVIKHNLEGAPERYEDIRLLFESELGYQGGSLEQYVRKFITTIRPSRSMINLGVSFDEFRKLIPWILNDPCIVTNPVDVTEESVLSLYEII